MSDVTINDVKPGDVCCLKKLPPRSDGTKFPRTATIISLDRAKNKVLMKFKVVVSGKIMEQQDWFNPQDIYGFYL
jgi:hypothetical protein